MICACKTDISGMAQTQLENNLRKVGFLYGSVINAVSALLEVTIATSI